MAQKLTNEEKTRVFSMYPGAPVFGGNPFQQFGTMQGTLLNRSICVGTCGLKNSIPNWVKIEHCQLALTPLSSITDEHAIEVAQFCGEWCAGSEDFEREYLLARGKEILHDPQFSFKLTYSAYQYLISKGYAVPLWFGVGHWANGKTAIELGIAIDKTKQA